MPLVKAETISPEACEAVKSFKSMPALVRSGSVAASLAASPAGSH